MLNAEITLLLFVGGEQHSDVTALVTGATRAAALDTIARAQAIPDIEQIIVSTDSSTFALQAKGLHVEAELDPPGCPFHFGDRLREIIAAHRVRKALYMGGGSGVLLPAGQLGQIVRRLRQASRLLLVNNHYSTDFAAFAPAEIISSVEPPATDNDLSFRLARAGLEPISLPRSAATLLDIDTPTDLMTSFLHPQVGPRLRQYIAGSGLDLTHIRRIISVLGDQTAQVFVLGRVSSSDFAYLEAHSSCQTRLLSEERGMRASGRQARGEVQSLAGLCLDRWGPEGFVRALVNMCDGAIIDSRVLFAHQRLWPSDDDRFNSDLLRPEMIQDPLVRSFTEAVREAPIPIILGGHSLVSGGLYALAEASRGERLSKGGEHGI